MWRSWGEIRRFVRLTRRRTRMPLLDQSFQEHVPRGGTLRRQRDPAPIVIVG